MERAFGATFFIFPFCMASLFPTTSDSATSYLNLDIPRGSYLGRGQYFRLSLRDIAFIRLVFSRRPVVPWLRANQPLPGSRPGFGGEPTTKSLRLASVGRAYRHRPSILRRIFFCASGPNYAKNHYPLELILYSML